MVLYRILRSAIKYIFLIFEPLIKYIPGIKIISRRMFKFLPSQQWFNIHNASLLVNIHDRGIGEYLFLRGKYALGRVSEIRKAVKEGDTVIDIGANIGYFTALMANLVGSRGRVFAFEPDPRNFLLLQCTIKKNGWDHVIAQQKAISNKEGNSLLYQTQSWSANALTPVRHISSIEVPIITLDNFLSEKYCINRINFVKIDTDGSEPLIIQGMVKLIQQSPNLKILTEYQPGNLKRYLSNPLDFIKIAEQCGLKLESILDSDTGRLPNLDLSLLASLPDDKNLDLLFIRDLT